MSTALSLLIDALTALQESQNSKTPSRERAIAITDLEKLIAWVSYQDL
jgi:hypothetical protein